MTRPDVHIIGAGLAGLSAAVELVSTGARIFVHEATKAAGGRCRSYYDQQLGMEIDNGNHLLLSGNLHALRYIKKIGAEERLTDLPEARFPFINLRNGRQWTLAPSPGPLPLWLLSRDRRAPDAHLSDYLDLLKLLWTAGDAPIGEVMRCAGPLYDQMTRPLLLAGLNTDPVEGSSALARQLIRDTLMKGAQACAPVIAREGLSKAFIDPALEFLERGETTVNFARRLRSIGFMQSRVTSLQFEDQTLILSPSDIVILAIPPQAAAALAPEIQTPDTFNAIINAHFAIATPPTIATLTGVTGALTEWLFAYPNRLSVTISAANHLLDRPLEELAREIWREVAMIAGIKGEMPRWRILREKRATFAATPDQNSKRPGTRTRYRNLLLAGDWTATGLPATIEGAIKSGATAAHEARHMMAKNSDAATSARHRKPDAYADHG